MPFEAGQVISRQYRRGPLRTWVQAMRVIADDETGLLLWQPVGGDLATLVDADGATAHQLTVDRMRDPRLVPGTWQGDDVLILMPPGAAHSVWWFFRAGVFTGYYINLEQPYARRSAAVETRDNVLDIVVTPDREWSWKDADEFDLRIGHPHYFDAAEAAAIRAEAERLVARIEAGEFPFDGSFRDFRPDPGWPTPRCPL